jgi:hypothetical protein
MLSVQHKATQQLIKIIAAAGGRYHIEMPDGTNYGQPLDAKKKKRSPRKGPINATYFAREMANVMAGDAAVIAPQEGDDIRRCAKNLSAWCSKAWGKESHMIATDLNKNVVEVLRLQ